MYPFYWFSIFLRNAAEHHKFHNWYSESAFSWDCFEVNFCWSHFVSSVLRPLIAEFYHPGCYQHPHTELEQVLCRTNCLMGSDTVWVTRTTVLTTTNVQTNHRFQVFWKKSFFPFSKVQNRRFYSFWGTQIKFLVIPNLSCPLKTWFRVWHTCNVYQYKLCFWRFFGKINKKHFWKKDI